MVKVAIPLTLPKTVSSPRKNMDWELKRTITINQGQKKTLMKETKAPKKQKALKTQAKSTHL